MPKTNVKEKDTTEEVAEDAGVPVQSMTVKGDVVIPQYEELKQLIANNKEFTQEVHDAIVSRIAALEGKVTKLGTTVSGIRGAERKYPRTKEYTVVPGDKLTGIAKKQLGQAGRFTEIAILNYDRYPSLKANPDHIQEGWKLRLPT